MSQDEQRISATMVLLLAAAEDRGLWISSDLRIGLSDAAALAGVSAGGMRNLVSRGAGPQVFRLGGAGHLRSVRLRDLAAWIESRRASGHV